MFLASNSVAVLAVLAVCFFVVIPFIIQVSRAVRRERQAQIIQAAKRTVQAAQSAPGYKRFAGDPAWRYCHYCRHSTDATGLQCPTCGATLPPARSRVVVTF